MGRSKPVSFAGKHFERQGDAVDYFNNQKVELLPEGTIENGELFESLKDVYERYCDNSPGYELNGRLITGFSVTYEKRHVEGAWATHPCFKVHFSNDELRPFSIKKAIKSLADNQN